jgi:clan AA aspartic protease
MIFGHVRDRFPRVSLNLPGLDGPVVVEFILDTGFDGDLALPASLIAQLETAESEFRWVRLADGRAQQRRASEITLDWNDEERITEVLALENPPLLGVGLMGGNLLQAEMQTGGEGSLEPL